MELIVRPVDINYVVHTWPLVEKFLSAALDTATEADKAYCYNIQHVQAFVSNGQWSLLIAIDKDNVIHGAATLSFVNYPLQRVAFITLCGGKFITNKSLSKQVYNICKVYGATKLQAYANGSRLRLWQKVGLKPVTNLMEVDL